MVRRLDSFQGKLAKRILQVSFKHSSYSSSWIATFYCYVHVLAHSVSNWRRYLVVLLYRCCYRGKIFISDLWGRSICRKIATFPFRRVRIRPLWLLGYGNPCCAYSLRVTGWNYVTVRVTYAAILSIRETHSTLYILTQTIAEYLDGSSVALLYVKQLSMQNNILLISVLLLSAVWSCVDLWRCNLWIRSLHAVIGHLYWKWMLSKVTL